MIIYLSVIDFAAIMQVFNINMDPALAEGLLTFCVPLGGLFGSYFSSFFITRLSRRYFNLKLGKLSSISMEQPFY